MTRSGKRLSRTVRFVAVGQQGNQLFELAHERAKFAGGLEGAGNRHGFHIEQDCRPMRGRSRDSRFAFSHRVRTIGIKLRMTHFAGDTLFGDGICSASGVPVSSNNYHPYTTKAPFPEEDDAYLEIVIARLTPAESLHRASASFLATRFRLRHCRNSMEHR